MMVANPQPDARRAVTLTLVGAMPLWSNGGAGCRSVCVRRDDGFLYMLRDFDDEPNLRMAEKELSLFVRLRPEPAQRDHRLLLASSGFADIISRTDVPMSDFYETSRHKCYAWYAPNAQIDEWRAAAGEALLVRAALLLGHRLFDTAWQATGAALFMAERGSPLRRRVMVMFGLIKLWIGGPTALAAYAAEGRYQGGFASDAEYTAAVAMEMKREKQND